MTAPRPDATLDQLRDLIAVANERHWHDAEGYLAEVVARAEERLADADSRGRRLTESAQNPEPAHGHTPARSDAGETLTGARDAR